MTTKTIAGAAALMLMLAAQSVGLAQSNVVGYNRFTVAPTTDVRVTVPFNQKVEGTFAVSGKSGTVISVTDTLTAGAYATSYYVRFISGNASGLWTTISGNTTNSFTVADTAVANLVSTGDNFRVYKHYTIATVFPKTMLNVSHLSGTKVLIYDNVLTSMGQNKAASKTATCNASGVWQGTATDTTILKPETQFVIRNMSASQTLTVTTTGTVPDYTVSMLIAANGDLMIGTGYPMSVTLKNAGLSGSLRKVLFFDNVAAGQNKAAVKTATASGANWVGTGVTGSELISPSSAVTLRLPSAEAGTKITITKPY